ncbi:hypothetical protein GEV33_000120 [Tenebrio molitor]|jgi:hypothetical protein|uniref:Uncharacterized protein n=1 Tax=Tenebrio molitor TaxID=7067 RepID=A0A8J6HZY1_TENMO|nr:hypothetical protein GEV33_000120 [Tenebrio molitor]
MQPVRREIGGVPRNVRTVEHEEAVLNVFEEDGTRSIRTVSREMGLSKSSVQIIGGIRTTIHGYNIFCQRIIQLGENFVYG